MQDFDCSLCKDPYNQQPIRYARNANNSMGSVPPSQGICFAHFIADAVHQWHQRIQPVPAVFCLNIILSQCFIVFKLYDDITHLFCHGSLAVALIARYIQESESVQNAVFKDNAILKDILLRLDKDGFVQVR